MRTRRRSFGRKRQWNEEKHGRKRKERTLTCTRSKQIAEKEQGGGAFEASGCVKIKGGGRKGGYLGRCFGDGQGDVLMGQEDQER